MTTSTFGDRTGSNFAGCEDAVLQSGFPNTNNSTLQASGELPTVFRFTGLSNIPNGSTVTNAFFTIKIDSGASGSQNIIFRKLLRAWLNTQVTWNSWITGSNWGTAGALNTTTDRNAAASATVVYPGGFSTADIDSTSNTTLIADIQAIVNGGVNNGWIIDATTGISLLLTDAVGADAPTRPMLTVVYGAAGPSIPLLMSQYLLG